MFHLLVSMRGTACAWLLTAAVTAQTTAWRHPDGTTHWYEAVAVPAGIDWATANASAAARGGYLATITSAAEANVVFAMVDSPEFWIQVGQVLQGPWIGGAQLPNSSEPAGGWVWGEGEPFAYTNWHAGQPDDNGNADRIHLGGVAAVRTPTWADAPGGSRWRGYVIEFSGTTAPRTVGLLQHEVGTSEGYTLFSPRRTNQVYLVDERGRVVHQWNASSRPGASEYLLPNGDLLRCGVVTPPVFPAGGAGGLIERFDWSGNVVWSFQYANNKEWHHHDIELLPNGNVLLIAWELKSFTEAVQAGRNPVLMPGGAVWPDKIVEIRPTGPTSGSVVWEWHAWDHLIQDFDSSRSNYGRVDQHPELIDINYQGSVGSADWLHINSIDYNPALDQILLSVPTFDEIWVIDHSTTTAQAASHSGGRSGKGGDLLYRWGNPAAYRAGTAQDQKLFFQHDATWIPAGLPGAGNFLVFNNGRGRMPSGFSSVDELVPPVDSLGNYPMTGKVFGPVAPTWSYRANGLFAASLSGAQRLPNGNTLVCDGPAGHFFEVTAQQARVWQYQNPVHNLGAARQGDWMARGEIFRVRRYPASHGAFRGRNLIPGPPLERHDPVLLADGSTARRPARVGTTVALDLRTAAGQAGRIYQLVTSGQAGLIGTDFRFARQGIDPLLIQTLTNALPAVFQNYAGTLDASGGTTARIVIPPVPALAGIELFTTAVVVDPGRPSSLGLISNTVRVLLR